LLSLFMVVWLVPPVPVFPWFPVTLSLWEVASFPVVDVWLFFMLSIAFCQPFLSSCDALSLASCKAVMLLDLLLCKDFLSCSALADLLVSVAVEVGGVVGAGGVTFSDGVIGAGGGVVTGGVVGVAIGGVVDVGGVLTAGVVVVGGALTADGT